ncbi:MAG TPA: hypothetical protein VE974_11040 [Thermoanaerobaculia bacterium]|nr:hypothetical protein [Thermoanaerobaculia bacterium]
MNGRIGFIMERLRHRRRLAGRVVLTAVLTGIPVALCAQSARAAEQIGPPAIAFEQGAVVITGITPGAQVIVFGIVREARNYTMRTMNVSVTLQSDERGEARLDLQRPVAATSIYAAVDYSSGDFVVASPPGTPLHVRPAQALRMKRNSGQEFDAFDFDAQWVEAIWVRPDQGAWKVSLMDGSGMDGNVAFGTVQPGAALMRPVSGESAPPVAFRPHDVLIAVDPYLMDVAATAVHE